MRKNIKKHRVDILDEKVEKLLMDKREFAVRVGKEMKVILKGMKKT